MHGARVGAALAAADDPIDLRPQNPVVPREHIRAMSSAVPSSGGMRSSAVAWSSTETRGHGPVRKDTARCRMRRVA